MKKFFFLLIIISGSLYYYYSISEPTPEKEVASDKTNIPNKVVLKKKTPITIQKPTHSHTTATSSIVAVSAPEPSTVDLDNAPSTEEETLATLSRALFIYASPEKTKEEFIENLGKWNIGPTVAEDKNPYTGSMSIIRTRKTLPGSRYIHAQYFANDDGTQTLQHLSFEYKPGKGQFEKTMNQVKKQFEIKSNPVNKKAGFISWNSRNGYNIWVKELTKEDLKENPFNAYTDKDVGTIRVAVELEIHEHMKGSSDIPPSN